MEATGGGGLQGEAASAPLGSAMGEPAAAPCLAHAAQGRSPELCRPRSRNSAAPPPPGISRRERMGKRRKGNGAEKGRREGEKRVEKKRSNKF